VAWIEWAFASLSGRNGWICPVLLAILTIVLALVAARTATGTRFLAPTLILVGGLAVTGLALTPFVLADAVRRGRLQAPAGPHAVGQQRIALPFTLARDAINVDPSSLAVQLLFPAERAGPNASPAIATPCEDALAALPIAGGKGVLPLLLYLPGHGASWNDNVATLTFLASQGYVIAALDDIARDTPSSQSSPHDEAVRLEAWQFGSAQAYDRTIALSDERVGRQARKALSALDRLSACAATHPHSSLGARVDFGRVGFLGFSFGGATAAEAAVLDSRIQAVANLDGSLFGAAYKGGLTAPYLGMISQYPFPTPEDLESGEPEARYYARLVARDLREQARLAAREGSAGVRVRGAAHESFSDAVFDPHLSRAWLFLDANRTHAIVRTHVLDFFDVHLRGRAPSLLGTSRSPVPGVQTFQDIGLDP